MPSSDDTVDLLVVGGGINGVGIARDAAGRGLRVALVEQNDLASATSSASSKLVHGGLRYLEHYQFALVHESLFERTVLLNMAPHIVRPQRFVLPHGPNMRPAWMLALGLFLYDHLGAAHPKLKPSRRVNMDTDAVGQPLAAHYDAGFIYADATVDDSRLVILNAVDATQRGARIMTRTRLTHAKRVGNLWRCELDDVSNASTQILYARAIANVAGPWARQVIEAIEDAPTTKNLRLVKGSHIVVNKLYDGDQAYILQNDDGRVVFVIPYHDDFTLIGTTEVELPTPPKPGDDGLECSSDETAYMCRAINRFFTSHIEPSDVVWAFAGVRPLVKDNAANATRASREYVLELLGQDGDAPLLSVFGGKLTTYRRLAEHALAKLLPTFPTMGKSWTSHTPLTGGDMADTFTTDLQGEFPALAPELLRALARRHGSRARAILNGVKSESDLGQGFGWGLFAREVDHFIDYEWAQSVDDVLWRRTKLGLRFTAAQRSALQAYIDAR